MYYNVLLCNTIYYYSLPVTALNRLDTEILGRGKLYSLLNTKFDSLGFAPSQSDRSCLPA